MSEHSEQTGGPPDEFGDANAPAVDLGAVDPDAVDLDAVERDLADLGAVDLDAVERDLADVEAALGRLADGTYWTDEVTGEALPEDLLIANPTARRA